MKNTYKITKWIILPATILVVVSFLVNYFSFKHKEEPHHYASTEQYSTFLYSLKESYKAGTTETVTDTTAKPTISFKQRGGQVLNNANSVIGVIADDPNGKNIERLEYYWDYSTENATNKKYTLRGFTDVASKRLINVALSEDIINNGSNKVHILRVRTKNEDGVYSKWYNEPYFMVSQLSATIDKTAPILDDAIMPMTGSNILPGQELTLRATDNESGIYYLSYAWYNDATPVKDIVVNRPENGTVIIKAPTEPGNWSLVFFAANTTYDNANARFTTSMVNRYHYDVGDKTAPEITILKPTVFSMQIHGNIPEFQAIAVDNFDTEAPIVQISGVNEIDKDKAGTYEIVFTATDKAGMTKIIKKNFVVLRNTLLVPEQVQVSGRTVAYTGTTQGLTIQISSIQNDAQYRNVKVNYVNVNTNQEETPVNVGTYKAYITIPQTDEYLAVNNVEIGEFKITKANLANSTLTLSEPSFNYDGTEKRPNVTVSLNHETLSAENYDVTYENNVQRGTATVTVTGKNNCEGTKSKTFTISPANIGNAKVTVLNDNYTYTGAENRPNVTVTINGKTLVNGTDYEVAYSQNVNAGTGIVTVTGKGNYDGKVVNNATFTIQPANIKDAEVILSQNTYTYTGNANEPEVTVKVGTKTLSRGTDYDVTYQNNVNVGTGTVIVTGKENYTGTVTPNRSFEINPKTIELTGTVNETYIYQGSTIEPGKTDMTVKIGEEITTSYEIVGYENNVNVGTGKVKISATGNYTSAVTEIPFTIIPKTVGLEGTVTGNYTFEEETQQKPVKENIQVTVNGEAFDSFEVVESGYGENINAGEGTVTIKANGNYTSAEKVLRFTIIPQTVTLTGMAKHEFTYNDGIAIEPTQNDFNVKVGEDEFTSYEILDYQDNVNVGNGTVKIRATGNYTSDEITISFEIIKKQVMLYATVMTEYTYDGTIKQPLKEDIEVKVDNQIFNDFEVISNQYGENINCGEGTVAIQATGNYTSEVITVTFAISQLNLSNTTLTLSEDSFIYDGTLKEPNVTVKVGENIVTTENYNIAYTNNTNAGTEATVTITGKNNCTGENSIHFTITQANLENADLELAENSYMYDGTAKQPAVTIKLGDNVVTEDNYDITYQNNTNVGTEATAMITGKNNCTGENSITFTITKADLDGATIELTEDSFVYDGTEKEPIITVKIEDNIVAEENYEITYQNNVNVGTQATVTITGKNNCKGTNSTTFTITKRNMADTIVQLSQDSFEYDGTPKAPTVIVKVDNNTISSDNYAVSYSDHTEASEELTITITGKNNCEGETTRTFIIRPANLENATITLSPTSYSYDGTEKEPEVVVKIGDSILPASNYHVTYSNNVNIGNEATVTIEGTNNCEGTKTANFAITKGNFENATITISPTSYSYDGTEKEPEVIVKIGNNILPASNYHVTYSNNVNIGNEATVTVDGTNNCEGTKTAFFTIKKQNLENATITLEEENFVYDGTTKEPTVTVKIGENVIPYTNYTVSYANNTNEGTNATVTITGKNNCTGEKNKTFTITKANLTNATIELSENVYSYDGTAKQPTVTVKLGNHVLAKENYTVSYTNNVNVGKNATVTITGKENCEGSKSETFIITEQDLSGATIELSKNSFVYDGTEKKPSVTVKLKDTTITSDNYIVAYTKNINVGNDATVTITGKNKYSGSASKTFTIEKANSEIKFEQENTTINYTSTPFSMKANIVKGTQATVVYTVDHDNIASIDANGNIKLLALGKVTVTAHYEGNSNYQESNANITLTIVDTEKPQIILPKEVQQFEAGEQYVPLEVTATDNYETPTVTNNMEEDLMKVVGTHTITYTATDSQGNEQTADVLVTIVDTTKPTLQFVKENDKREISYVMMRDTEYQTPEMVATDNSSVEPVIETVEGFGENFNNRKPGNYIVKYVAVDGEGLKSEELRVNVLVQNYAPVITYTENGSPVVIEGNGEEYATELTISFNGSGVIYKNGSTTSEAFQTGTKLADGSYKIVATNPDGASTTAEFTIKTTGPDLMINNARYTDDIYHNFATIEIDPQEVSKVEIINKTKNIVIASRDSSAIASSYTLGEKGEYNVYYIYLEDTKGRVTKIERLIVSIEQ